MEGCSSEEQGEYDECEERVKGKQVDKAHLCVVHHEEPEHERDKDKEVDYVLGEDYVMSAKDLCTIDFIDELIESGINSFKIEGRMRSSEYIKVVTSVYREAIDSYFEGSLDSKKKELIMITSESMEEENKLKENREKAASKVEDRLLNSYNKIRNNARNGLGVVSIARSACGGCFNVVPPQRQAEVREKKKIIVCEHCGRIFVDIEDAPVVEEKKTRRARK